MKNNDKTPYLVLFIGIASILAIFISTFGRAYAFYTSFYTTPGFNIIGREPFAMFDTGSNFRTTMNTLAGNIKYINSIERYSSPPTGVTPVHVNTENSTLPILMWYSANTIYYYSPSDIIYLNPDSSQMIGCAVATCNISGIKSINMTGWNTSRVTNMYAMFEYTSNLDLTPSQVNNWNTSSVTNMSHMFRHSKLSMTALNLSDWNTKAVTNMSYMFDSSGIHSLDISGWNTYKVTDMSSMFNGVGQLTSFGNIENWNVTSVKNMSRMFSDIHNLGFTTLNVYNWNTHNVINMASMFSNTTGLTTINVSNWNTYNVQSMYGMFNYASSLNQIGTVAGTINLSNWNVKNVTNMNSMFRNTTSSTLKNYYLQNWNTYKVKDMGYMFEHSRAYNYYTNNWVTTNVTSTANMFYYTNNLVHVNMYKWSLVNLSTNTSMFVASNLKNFYSPASIKAGINIMLPYTVKYSGTSYSKLNSTTPKSVLFKYS